MENIQETEQKEHKPFKRYIGLGAGILIAVAGAFFIHDALMYQSTDDAYVEAHMVQVSPKVTGQIVELYVTDNQFVEAGDVVAVIDKDDYKITL